MELTDDLICEHFRTAYDSARDTSSDPFTHVGAVVVARDGRIAGIGSNHFPRGVAITAERTVRPTIHDYILHGEETSILDAAFRGVPTAGATMFGPWAACTRCGRQIIDSGIALLVRHKEMMDRTPERWVADIRKADEMLREAGVEIVEWSGVVGNCSQMIVGEVWYP